MGFLALLALFVCIACDALVALLALLAWLAWLAFLTRSLARSLACLLAHLLLAILRLACLLARLLAIKSKLSKITAQKQPNSVLLCSALLCTVQGLHGFTLVYIYIYIHLGGQGIANTHTCAVNVLVFPTRYLPPISSAKIQVLALLHLSTHSRLSLD
jgi:hypothetical protein